MTHPDLRSNGRYNACDLPAWHRKSLPHQMPLELHNVYCAVRLLGEKTPGKRGVIGSGFFVSVMSETEDDWFHDYLVTAHHVIEDLAVEVQVPDVTADGRLLEPVPVRRWCQPLKDVDLAVAPLPPQRGRMTIRLWDQVVRGDGAGTALFPGSVIYYIGHLDPLDRTMVRSGTIGALDQTGLDLNESPHQTYDYTTHLVDCRSYEGFSGSPCFVDLPFAKLDATDAPIALPEGVTVVGDLLHLTLLCGMFTNHLDYKKPTADDVVSRFGVGVMLRSEEIVEALMTDDLREERVAKDAADKAAEAEDRPRLRQTRADGPGDEFDRFEDLTRKLVNTPKSEVDEKRKAKKDAS